MDRQVRVSADIAWPTILTNEHLIRHCTNHLHKYILEQFRNPSIEVLVRGRTQSGCVHATRVALRPILRYSLEAFTAAAAECDTTYHDHLLTIGPSGPQMSASAVILGFLFTELASTSIISDPRSPLPLCSLNGTSSHLYNRKSSKVKTGQNQAYFTYDLRNETFS